jgi:hypothetical protein
MANELLTIDDIFEQLQNGGDLVASADAPRIPWPVWLNLNNKKRDRWPSTRPRRLGLPKGLLGPRDFVAIRIIHPRVRLVGGLATRKRDRIIRGHARQRQGSADSGRSRRSDQTAGVAE